MLELAAGLMAIRDNGGLVHADVALRARDDPRPRQLLWSDAAPETMARVAAGEALLGIANPAAVLGLAVQGLAPFGRPLDLRAVAVVPSPDCMVFALRPGLELSSVEDIAATRAPLRVSLRSGPGDAVNIVLDHVVAAAGFTWAQLREWGGSTFYDEGVPARGTRLEALLAGRVDAVFDEGAALWLDAAVEGGCTVLGLREPTVRRLETIGIRRAVIGAGDHSGLPADVLTVDYSDWPLYVRSDAPDDVVRMLCEVIVQRADALPWDGSGSLPLDLACRGTTDGGLGAQLHEAARQFWSGGGYLAAPPTGGPGGN